MPEASAQYTYDLWAVSSSRSLPRCPFASAALTQRGRTIEPPLSAVAHVKNRTIAKYWREHPLSARSVCDATSMEGAGIQRACRQPNADNGALLLKASQRKGMNVMVETSGR